MGTARVEGKISVGGSRPHLPSPDKKITKAVAGNWVLPFLVETKPAEKVEESNAVKSEEKKPPLQITGTCGRCGGHMYYREGWKAERCFSCSGD